MHAHGFLCLHTHRTLTILPQTQYNRTIFTGQVKKVVPLGNQVGPDEGESSREAGEKLSRHMTITCRFGGRGCRGCSNYAKPGRGPFQFYVTNGNRITLRGKCADGDIDAGIRLYSASSGSVHRLLSVGEKAQYQIRDQEHSWQKESERKNKFQA